MSLRETLPTAVQEMVNSCYWRVVIRPQYYDANRIEYASLESVLRGTQVRLRGWYFPHLTNRREEISHGATYISTWSDFSNYEYWRFYQSAQLLHLHGMREYVDEDYRAKMNNMNKHFRGVAKDVKIVGYVDIINFLYTVTEYFEFAARLGKLLRLEIPIDIIITLENIAGFVLGVSDPSRAWNNFYQATEASLNNSWSLDRGSIGEPEHAALNAVSWFFQRFGWLDVNLEALRAAQVAFLRRT